MSKVRGYEMQATEATCVRSDTRARARGLGRVAVARGGIQRAVKDGRRDLAQRHCKRFWASRRGRATLPTTRTRQFILGAVAGLAGRRWEDGEEREEKKFDAHDVQWRKVEVTVRKTRFDECRTDFFYKRFYFIHSFI